MYNNDDPYERARVHSKIAPLIMHFHERMAGALSTPKRCGVMS